MTKDEITKNLDLVPKEVVESNLDSWKSTALFYKEYIDSPLNELLSEISWRKTFTPIYNSVKNILTTEQAKLFRAGHTVYELLISTANEHGLKSGEHYIRIASEGGFIIIQYEIMGSITDDGNPKAYESIVCTLQDDLMPALQPLLTRLWNETRGKENA
jgi:hypothetical protein